MAKPNPRPDVRLDDAPMEPVTCETCQQQVEVRKSTWDQTSIQWHRDAMEGCVERRASNLEDGRFPGCSALRDSVRKAAVLGQVHIVSDLLDLKDGRA
ncbi:MAG: ferredoxin [Propionibacterium sp.]|nr:ferredoxin [Propionibacterium sp.]